VLLHSEQQKRSKLFCHKNCGLIILGHRGRGPCGLANNSSSGFTMHNTPRNENNAEKKSSFEYFSLKKNFPMRPIKGGVIIATTAFSAKGSTSRA